MNSNGEQFPTVLQRYRLDAGFSTQDLGGRTFVTRAAVSNIENGRRRAADRRWVETADSAVSAGGALVAAWDRDQARRDAHQRTNALLDETAQVTDELLTLPDVADVDELHAGAADLAVQYLHTPPEPMLDDTSRVYRELARRLRNGAHHQQQVSELQVALGHAAGVMAYAALDLGRPVQAERHAKAVFRMGSLSGNTELQAWARGTQSLIARFGKDYSRAFALVKDGMRYVDHTAGTAGLRLLAGAGQCMANLGDPEAAMSYLDQADQARQAHHPEDAVRGLFTFSEAKQRYYGGSSLMWIPDTAVLRRAAADATAAIDMWAGEPDESRPADDEALAHVYAATAHTRLGDLDAAMSAVRPVLGLPPEQRISWITKRVGELAQRMQSGRFAGSVTAASAVDELQRFTGAA